MLVGSFVSAKATFLKCDTSKSDPVELELNNSKNNFVIVITCVNTGKELLLMKKVTYLGTSHFPSQLFPIT